MRTRTARSDLQSRPWAASRRRSKCRSRKDVRRTTSPRTSEDAFKSALTAEYNVEVDDGEDVLVKAKDPTPKFTVALVDSNVKSVRIHVEHE